MKDKCIMCGKETQYDVSTHIDLRHNYVEGAGQLCDDCASGKPIKKNTVEISVDKIKELSNNYELGNYVRGLIK